MAVAYGAEVGIERGTLVLAIVVVDLVGTPFAVVFGVIAARVGAKRAIVAGLVVYTCVAILGYYLTNATQFMCLALLVASVQGGVQSLTRSLFASLVPAERSAGFFGFFTMAGRLTSTLGPALFALVATVTGSSRSAILSTIVLFASGTALLRAVDLKRGWTEARESDLGATPR
jgi:UMF1 family MFS transporter